MLACVVRELGTASVRNIDEMSVCLGKQAEKLLDDNLRPFVRQTFKINTRHAKLRCEQRRHNSVPSPTQGIQLFD
jgi:hypothetical protein